MKTFAMFAKMVAKHNQKDVKKERKQNDQMKM